MADELQTDAVSPSSSDDTTPPPPPAATDVSPSSGTDDTSPSSGDSRQSDRDGLLAAVKKVVETKPETSAIPSDDADAETRDRPPQDQAAATGTGDKPPDVSTTEAPKPEADPTEAELKKLRPETRRRFEVLLAQRNEARQSWENIQPELQQHRQLTGYLQQHQLAPDDVNILLGVGAALRRGDYQSFLSGVTPYVMAAQEALGLRISQDLQSQVDDGLIDENAARELTRTRHRAAQAEARLQDHAQVATVAQQTQQTEGIRTAVDTWERNIQVQDPDYARMSGAVRRYAQGLLQERGIPQTQQQAVELVRAAYDEVKATFGRAQPAPRPTRNSPSSIHVATGASNGPEPRNIKEAVVMALANMRRAS